MWLTSMSTTLEMHTDAMGPLLSRSVSHGCNAFSFLGSTPRTRDIAICVAFTKLYVHSSLLHL